MRVSFALIWLLQLGYPSLAQENKLDTAFYKDRTRPVVGCCYDGMQFVLRLRQESRKYYRVWRPELSKYKSTEFYIFRRADSTFLTILYAPHKPADRLYYRADIHIKDAATLAGIENYLEAIKGYQDNPCYDGAHGTHEPDTGRKVKNSTYAFWFFRFDYMPPNGSGPVTIKRHDVSGDDSTECYSKRQMRIEWEDIKELLARLNDYLALKGLPLIE